MPLIFLTNDDGIQSQGLSALAEALAPLGEIVIFAPEQDQSATGHALTLDRPLRVNALDARRNTVSGTPTDCVYLGTRGILEARPDLLVSGINYGGNLADDITYSGTVAAAMEGTLMGIPSFAISLDGRVDCDFRAAAGFASKLAARILAQGLPTGVFLNVNVPNLPPEKVRPALITRQGKRIYGESVIHRLDPRGRKYYWIGGEEVDFVPLPNSDIVAVRQGHISVTPIRMDMTDHPLMAELETWNL